MVQVTDTPRNPDRPDSPYEPAESPYDSPTEQIPPSRSGTADSAPSTAAFGAQRSDRLPRTEDELDFPHSGSSSVGGSTAGNSAATSSAATSSAATEKIPTYRRSAYSDASAESDRTAVVPAADSYGGAAEPAVRTETVELPARRGTTDLGLLVLRVTVGAVFLFHGLQKLLGLWDGPGLDGFQSLLESSGYRYPEILAIAAAVGETLGGALLILGLATPLAGAAVLATIINAWCFKQVMEPGLQFSGDGGVEYETVLGLAAAAIILAGPGRIAFDGRRGWATRPSFGSVLVLVIGIAAGACIWIFLNGANPVVR